MSQILTGILDKLRAEYCQLLEDNQGTEPLLNAEKLCSLKLAIDTDLLAQIIIQDPSLLAARAKSLVKDREEFDDPSAGLIIAMNIYNAALEVLLEAAVENQWLKADQDGVIQFDSKEIDASEKLALVTADYSVSKVALENVSNGSTSPLNQLFNAAESAFLAQLETQVSDAYSLAIQTAGAYSVFSPEDISPLIEHNPLLLGLRADDMVIDEVFANDPPAGIIISSHITQLVIEHLLEIAINKGALALDAQGQVIQLADSADGPVIH